MSPPVMPFGKYKGTPVAQVPSSYLRWMLRSIDRLDATLRREAQRVLRQREADGSAEQEAGQPGDWHPVVKVWFARLSLAYHPDRGGTDEQMRVVNNARDLLEQLLREARP